MRSEGKKGLIHDTLTIDSLIVACKLCEKRSIVTSPSRTTLKLMKKVVPRLERQAAGLSPEKEEKVEI